MRTKYIVLVKSNSDKKYHCFDKLYDSKEAAVKDIRNSMSNSAVSGLHDWRETKIVPISWGYIDSRSLINVMIRRTQNGDYE